MLRSDDPIPAHLGPELSARAVDLDGVALPISDRLVVIAPDGAVVALDAAGRLLWEALRLGCTVDDLVDACVQGGTLSEDAARTSIERALGSWHELGLIDGAGPERKPEPRATTDVARRAGQIPQLDEVYSTGDRRVRVRCDDRVLAGVIEAACGSCRVEGGSDAHAAVDVVEQRGWFAVRADQAVLTRADDLTQNRALARHRCLTALIEIARGPRRLLGILHASAVAAHGHCVVFPGAKGSGKSTLAAALVAAGADFVTDDYAPLEQASWLVWPVPYAPGIKRGSWRSLRRYYPNLDAHRVHRLVGLQIRYLQLEAPRMAAMDQGLPIRALVFPRYQAGAALEHERMTTADALTELCHARALLDRQPQVFAETMRWVESVPAYRLVYGDLSPAIEWVLSMLGEP